MVTMDSFPKTIASLNSYRNARITTTLNLLTSWTLHGLRVAPSVKDERQMGLHVGQNLHILYNISHWQLRILSPPLDFSTLKKLSLGALSPGRHATGLKMSATELVGSHKKIDFSRYMKVN